jgi:hypothetical protein
MRTSSFCAAAAVACLLSNAARADLVITQYYSNTVDNHHWIELLNSGTEAISLSSYSLGIWRNDYANGYQSLPSVRPHFATAILPNFSLMPGSVFSIYNYSAVGLRPNYDTGTTQNMRLLDAFSASGSVGLFAGTAYNPANLIDAIGFRDNFTYGSNISYVRLTLDPGYSLTEDTDVTNYADVWQPVSIADVNGAAPGTNARLGFANPAPAVAAVAAIPEAHSWLGGLAIAAIAAMVHVYRYRTAAVPSGVDT